MRRQLTNLFVLLAMATPALSGCQLRPSATVFTDDLEHYEQLAGEVAFDDTGMTSDMEGLSAPPPITLDEDNLPPYWDITLDEAVQLAMANSKVLRDLGGTVLRSPESVPTIYRPALVATNPRFGIEAALSSFDTQLATQMFFEKNDRALNNILTGGGSRLVIQDLATFQTQLSKQTTSGSTLAIRKNLEYDANNAPGNLFPSFWDANIEAEIRQPLLQGAGTEFNRIAGPSNIPGQIDDFTGVVIARLNTDVSLADFNIAVRNHVSNVENAYWDLYFAYRDLDAKIAARDSSLHTWRIVKSWAETGRRGGEAEKEAQAREQYYRFQEDVQNAYSGRPVEGTRTNNGSGGGTFRSSGGVLTAERRLRLILGLPANDGKLMRPSDGPVMARVVFDWTDVLPEASSRRSELRRQKTVVKRQEMELIASRNYLLPRVDTIGRYRWRGFGDELIDTTRAGKGEFDNAIKNLTGGDFQEWQLGVEVSVPLGFRRAHAAVRNAQLRVAREKTVLREQEREIVSDLSTAIAELDRAFTVSQTTLNRLVAAREQLAAAEVAWDRGKAPVDLVLDAQARLADSDSRYFRELVAYAMAVKNIHFEKGSLLEYNGVFLAEGPKPSDFCRACDYVDEEGGLLNYVLDYHPGEEGRPVDEGHPVEEGQSVEEWPPLEEGQRADVWHRVGAEGLESWPVPDDTAEPQGIIPVSYAESMNRTPPEAPALIWSPAVQLAPPLDVSK